MIDLDGLVQRYNTARTGGVYEAEENYQGYVMEHARAFVNHTDKIWELLSDRSKVTTPEQAVVLNDVLHAIHRISGIKKGAHWDLPRKGIKNQFEVCRDSRLPALENETERLEYAGWYIAENTYGEVSKTDELRLNAIHGKLNDVQHDIRTLKSGECLESCDLAKQGLCYPQGLAHIPHELRLVIDDHKDSVVGVEGV